MKFTIIGSALSGNKGAAAMLESSLQTLGGKYPDAEFVLLSMYPEEDAKLNVYPNLTILPASVQYIGLVLNPLALLYKILPPFRGLILKNKQLRAIKESDALLDQGGITFTDGRELFLLYNVASILPAIFVRTKVIKCAQALGPFNNPINKFVSKLILPKVSLIIARGQKTYEYLQTLNLNNVVLATDYAFSLDITQKDQSEGELVYKKSARGVNTKNKLKVGLSPSVVVKKKCETVGVDYVALMQWFVNDLIKQGYVVTLIPHSVRTGTTKSHNNDLPLCEVIYSGVEDKKSCVFINKEVSSQALRYIIGKTDLFVACRFHAMVSSLAMGVPTLVLGWSHKYMEILERFDVKEFGIDSRKLSQETLSESFETLLNEKDQTAKKLKQHLPEVRKLSLTHIQLIADTIEE